MASETALEGSRGGLPDERLQFGEDLLDRIEVGRVFGQEQQMRADGPDGPLHSLAFMRSEIVEHDHVVALESGREELLDIGAGSARR